MPGWVIQKKMIKLLFSHIWPTKYTLNSKIVPFLHYTFHLDLYRLIPFPVVNNKSAVGVRCVVFSSLLRPDQRLLFVVVSNDIPWCRRIIAARWRDRRQVVFISTEDIAVDLAVLSLCNHSIVTSGTYGWWAAWLVNGTTVYYRNFPRRGSRLANGFKATDYYKPNWIGMI